MTGKKSMTKKIMLFALCSLLLASRFPAEAQQSTKVPRVGFLAVSGDPNTPGPWVEAFRQGLRDFGYIEGKNILVKYRYIGGDKDRIPSLVVKLLQLKVDVLVSPNLPAIRAAKEANPFAKSNS